MCVPNSRMSILNFRMYVPCLQTEPGRVVAVWAEVSKVVLTDLFGGNAPNGACREVKNGENRV